MKDSIQEALQKCQKELDESKQSGGLAENAAEAFHRLATRVDGVLEERRVTPDRRGTRRSARDRRDQKPGAPAGDAPSS